MVALLADYPLTKTRDLRSAMAETLCAYLLTIPYRYPRTNASLFLKAAYEEWATFEQRAMSQGGPLPAACVLPDTPEETDSSFTPGILMETWSGAKTGDGYALFAVSEKTVPFMVLVRATSRPERKAIISAIEDAFVDLGIPGELADQPRFGKILTLASYYSQRARFTLLKHELLDQESSAKENRWLLQLSITAEARHVIPRRVRALDIRVQTLFNGASDNR